MLRVSRYIYIHFLTIAMFAVFYLNGHIKELVISYSIMLIHELAHLIAAAGIGLKVSHIALYPFGVNLRLKNKIVDTIADEIILYAAGPAANAVMASAALIIGRGAPSYYLSFFYRANIILLIINLLPAAPLDGGCILKKLLAYRFGGAAADRTARILSAVFSFMLLGAGVCVLYMTGYNYSVMLLAVFMIGSVFTQKEKYSAEYLKELMFYKNKSRRRVRLMTADAEESAEEISKRFIPSAYSIICMLDKNDKVRALKSESEVVEEILGR